MFPTIVQIPQQFWLSYPTPKSKCAQSLLREKTSLRRVCHGESPSPTHDIRELHPLAHQLSSFYQNEAPLRNEGTVNSSGARNHCSHSLFYMAEPQVLPSAQQDLTYFDCMNKEITFIELGMGEKKTKIIVTHIGEGGVKSGVQHGQVWSVD